VAARAPWANSMPVCSPELDEPIIAAPPEWKLRAARSVTLDFLPIATAPALPWLAMQGK
jgi:hypothetical protein